MCVDYRTLNRRTITDQYTVPRIDDALDCLSGSKWFSVLDRRSGYYQIPMAEKDQEKTAFICPLGFFQFERMPQGITGAPATFQRLMEKAVGDMHMLEVIVYLDDLIVFGKTLEEHEQRLLKVITRLEEAGLKLSLDKCQFCRSQVTYVRHIVSEHGIATDPGKIEAVTRWKQPTDLHSLQSFLGFCESTIIAESLGVSPEGIPECFAFPVRLDLGSLSQLSHTDLVIAQDVDSTIAPVKQSLCGGPSFICSDNPNSVLLNKEASKLFIQNNLLYRKVEKNGTEVKQLVLPREYVPMVLRSLHDESGHLGMDKTIEFIRNRFYWPKMGVEVEKYIKNCGRCITRKALPQRAAPLKQITSQGPLDLVCIDFLSLEPDSQGFANILVVTDHFTRYAQAFPAKDQKATTVAKILCERYFVHYGLPARIHSDQGRDFESKLIQDLLMMLGICKSRTSPYHPQGDPQPERFNRTLLSMLGTLDPKQKQKWSQKISQLVHAYNCSQNDATGYSPYLLMFGREARLPVDICFGVTEDNQKTKSYHQYVSKLKKDLQRAYSLATEAADKNHQRNKKAHDRHVKEQVLDKGDRVLLRNFGVTGKNKLKCKWRSSPYIVIEKLANLPVYKIKPERGMGAEKTIHRNHLLPIGYLVRILVDEREEGSQHRPVTRAFQQKTRDLVQTNNHEEDMSSEIEYDEVYLPRPVELDWDKLLTCPELSTKQSKPIVTEPERPAQDPVEIEPVVEDFSNLPPNADPEINVLEEGAAVNPSPDTQAGIEQVERSKRVTRPVVKLSYDELGNPCDYPVTVLSHGVLVGSGLYGDSRSSTCQTLWCHPMALCFACSNLASTLDFRTPIVFGGRGARDLVRESAGSLVFPCFQLYPPCGARDAGTGEEKIRRKEVRVTYESGGPRIRDVDRGLEMFVNRETDCVAQIHLLGAPSWYPPDYIEPKHPPFLSNSQSGCTGATLTFSSRPESSGLIECRQQLFPRVGDTVVQQFDSFLSLHGKSEEFLSFKSMEQRLDTFLHQTLNTSYPELRSFLQRLLLLSHGQATEDELEGHTNQIMKVLVIHNPTAEEDPSDVLVVIEGNKVLTGCGNKTTACILLMGLMYALNLEYPKTLKYTFDMFQKLSVSLSLSAVLVCC
ncbi:interleukin-1 receptor accessory protein-like 1-A [Pimephales promelas]|nr:interleukin-1 receptor accessory protein-like 1-A [Pimephales promelas]